MRDDEAAKCKAKQVGTICSAGKDDAWVSEPAARRMDAIYRWLTARRSRHVACKDTPSVGWLPFLPAIWIYI